MWARRSRLHCSDLEFVGLLSSPRSGFLQDSSAGCLPIALLPKLNPAYLGPVSGVVAGTQGARQLRLRLTLASIVSGWEKDGCPPEATGFEGSIEAGFAGESTEAGFAEESTEADFVEELVDVDLLENYVPGPAVEL